MLSSFLSRGGLSLTVVSLLTSCVAGEVFEKLSAVPQGWHYVGNPNSDEPISLKIALKQHNAAGFEQAVIQMSTPGHANYGKHFQDHTEMKRMLLPLDDTVDSVKSWIESAGITDYQVDADWINLRTDVGHANALLDTEFKFYQNEIRHITRLRTLAYSIPDDVVSHVNMIQPTTRFGQIRPDRATSRTNPEKISEHILSAMALAPNSTDCDQMITPACLKKLYNVGDYKADPKRGSRIGFTNYLEEVPRYSDMQTFQKTLALYAEGQNFSVVTYNGGVNNQHAASDSGEANLDLQTIMGISSPVPITAYITGGRGELIPDLSQPNKSDNSNEPYLEFFQNVLKLSKEELPQVISTSYGEDEQTIPQKYAETVCDLIKQLGSRGVSVIFSSGDSGVGAACQTNDGTNQTHFPPQFPAACPWVTAVGGTTKTNPEEATVFSSGGFSDVWEQPEWQTRSVDGFLESNDGKFEKYFNRHGRAFPDVSAQSANYAIYDKGRWGKLDGTSCSAPAFAGLVALLNDARFAAGKPSMGFLNPFLYGAGQEGLNDVTAGSTKGCDGRDRFGGKPNGSPVVSGASWNATEGWDPATGLGTPNFEKLKELALKF
ncbi:hypothetical protein FE257_011492 [Aspergillus nanangensis]|uniref:tripeptidyl-peptidase II n=1 Tax=Aspergillus nanangensis TaxID=2582783 RepID=A0AAD4GRB2_ASPNN|nr:hypothetical protein FE257_011492 [Aspergillus nanangensis]